METITFRCTKCQYSLKIGADKAGRTAKCSKCGTLLTIPAKSEVASVPAVPSAPKKTDDDDGDGELAFQLQEMPDLAKERLEQAERNKAKILEGPGRKETKKKAKITNPFEWRKVGFGCKVIACGLGLWLVAYMLNHLPLFLGMAEGERFAAAANNQLVKSNDDLSKPPDLNLCAFGVAVIGGESWAGAMKVLMIFSFVVYLLQYGPLLAGYFICLAVPERFGTRLQLKILFGLAFVNALCLVIFKLLPMAGAYGYTNMPFVMPEIAMMGMNAERQDSLFIFWQRHPIIEAYGAILMTFLLYLEPAIIATFVFAVAKGIKSGDLEGSALVGMKLAYSQIFIQVVWLMACLCGTSVVLLWALRFVYAIGMGFFVGQMWYMILLLFTVSGVVEEQLGDDAPPPGSLPPEDDTEDEDGEDEDDEDEDD